MSLKNAMGGVALLAGTAIGAAILALPIATAHLGFIQTILLYLGCWLFMTLGALYLLEANLAIGNGRNLITIAERSLGKIGQYATWFIYLVLLYALIAAYLTGMGAWINQVLSYFQIHAHLSHCAILGTLFTLVVISLGTLTTDWVNRFLMIGLIGAFATLIFATLPHVQLPLLLSDHGVLDLRPFPIIITAFGSAIVIPTLTDYLHGKPKQLLSVVLIGSFLPLLVYILWEISIVGVIPFYGNPGLAEIQHFGHPATDVSKALEMRLHEPVITRASTYFSIFALITSLLGVCLSLFDFLADGLHLRKNFRGKIILSIITFLPPLLFAIFYPQAFALTLSFAGIFAAILLGLLPALFVWQIRYRLKLKRPLTIRGGKFLLICVIAFSFFIVGIECLNQWEHYKGHF